ncbi:MAG: lysylphosphatidylglycerol synthase transmembrane domain-containing protein [Actinomycetes bacterium]
MGEFFHAVRVFGDQLAAVRWEYLAVALALGVAKLVFRAIAWRTILRASFPGERLRFRSVFGAYVAGVGVNSIVPARGGDAVKLYLIKHRIPDATYPTLAPTLLAETMLDMVVAGGLMLWAFAIGVLPTHQVYAHLPAVDWRFFLHHSRATEIGLGVTLAVAVVALLLFIERGGDFRARVAQGFAILADPPRFLRGVVLPQAIAWVFRIAALYYFLLAFDVHASVHNALLVQVVESLATLFPATPGGAGTKQGLIVYIFRGQALSDSLLLAFSVGMNIANVLFGLVLGSIALFAMARTFSWRGLKPVHDEIP